MKPRAAPTGDGAQRCPCCGSAQRELSAGCPRCGAPAGWQPETTRRPLALKGFSATLLGMQFVGRHPGLWTWIVVPLVVNVLLFVGLTWWLIASFGSWAPDLSATWPGWIDWLRVGLDALGVTTLLNLLLGTVCILASLLATLLLSGVINSPFYDVLSDRTECLFFGQKDPGRGWTALPRDTLRSLTAALSLAARQLAVLTLLFIASFFVVGAPFFMAAGFYFTGLGLIDVTLSRKLYRGRVRARWARRHLPAVLALGVPVSLLPPLAPFGIVGATLLFLQDPDKP